MTDQTKEQTPDWEKQFDELDAVWILKEYNLHTYKNIKKFISNKLATQHRKLVKKLLRLNDFLAEDYRPNCIWSVNEDFKKMTESHAYKHGVEVGLALFRQKLKQLKETT